MADTTSRAPLVAEEGRAARKQRAILEAATTVFLRHGYMGASMDEVAAIAAVSKQTVYKHFSDKESLFTEVVARSTDSVDQLTQAAALSLDEADDLTAGLLDLTRRFAAWLMQPQVLQLRRLVIAEAARFPEVGTAWYQQGFERVLATLAGSLRRLDEAGRLRVDDADLAAQHLMGLLLWIPVNRVMFQGEAQRASDAELDGYARAAVRVFLAAYGRP